MIFRLIPLLFQDPGGFVLVFGFVFLVISLSLVVAITVHEFSHALVASLLGDDTARRQGRLSLNPLVHLDTVGTILIFLVGFGWGKPVPVNPGALRSGPRAGMAQVALAGPLANLAAATIFALPIRLGLVGWHSPLVIPTTSYLNPSWLLGNLLGFLVLYNILLAVFNLIPLAPLDGFRVLLGILPRQLAFAFARLERWGPALLLTVIAVDNFSSVSILWTVMEPAANLVSLVLLRRPVL